MIISLNTDTMNELAACAMQINSELEEACACLAPITEHDDWNCAERDNVNEAIIQLKACFNQLKDCSENFSSVVRKAAFSFSELELSHSQTLQGLHSVLANALAINTPDGMPDSIQSLNCVHPWHVFNNSDPVPFPLSQSYYPYIVKNFDTPLKVVDFRRISINK